MCCFTFTYMHTMISLMPQCMLLIDCRFVGFFIIVYCYKDLQVMQFEIADKLSVFVYL